MKLAYIIIIQFYRQYLISYDQEKDTTLIYL